MRYALRDDRYPIETAEQVKTAAIYFTKNLNRFSPSDRVEVATNLEKAAEELSVELKEPWIINYSRMMKKEASTKYSPDFETNMKMRRDMCNVYDVKVNVGDQMVKAAGLIDKLIAEKPQTEPFAMVTAVGEFDKLANLEAHYDNRILDPVFTVFGSLNNPEYDLEKISFDSDCTVKEVQKAAKNKDFIKQASDMMGAGFAADFEKNPVSLLNSLPATEKQLMTEKIIALR